MTASKCMSGITQPTDTPIDASECYSLAPEKRSSCEPNAPMPFGSGGGSSTPALTIEPDSRRPESIAPCSETKAHTAVRTSYVKRMRLLIASDLIAGITPTSVRKRSAQATLDFAFSRLAGSDAGALKADCSFSKDSPMSSPSREGA